MDQGGGDLLWLALLGFMVVVLFLPQWLARRRQKKQKESLQIGDQVLTIGGFVGELTHLDLEENIARLKLAEGVEVQIVPGAISGKRASQETSSRAPSDSLNATESGDEAQSAAGDGQ